MHHHVLVVPSSSSDLMSQTDDTNPSQTNTYLYTRSSTSDQVSKTGIMVSNDNTVSQFPVMKSSSSKFLIDCSLWFHFSLHAVIATSVISTMIPSNSITIFGAIGGTIIVLLVSIVALSTAVIFIGIVEHIFDCLIILLKSWGFFDI